METENKIIKWLIENREGTIRDIAKNIKSDYKITHVAVQRLINKKIILPRTIGKSILCSLNKFYYGQEIYLAENERKENLLRNKNIKQLSKEIMTGINTSFFILFVFGSYAGRKEGKNSDIDLMFISNEAKFEEKIHSLLSLVPLKTHLFVFTEEEFVKMKESKKLNVVQEAINSNVLLYGIENYYKLKNA